ncbi:hypothetical protein [Nocardia sp. NPDC059239]|uniref:hypothetical protein n=1 Tax=Nocardia sp. NPDC059239 TaxID=3346785 RepID=UPI0036AEBD81
MHLWVRCGIDSFRDEGATRHAYDLARGLRRVYSVFGGDDGASGTFTVSPSKFTFPAAMWVVRRVGWCR